MTKPYDFTSLPKRGDFDSITSALVPEGAPRSRQDAQDFAIITALERAQQHPDDRHACDLSFSPVSALYVPLQNGMSGEDVFTMKGWMEKAELFLVTAQTSRDNSRKFLKDSSFKFEVNLMSLVDQKAVDAYTKATKANDFAQTVKALIALHKSALGEAKKLFESFDTPGHKPSATETLIAEALPIRGQKISSSLDVAALK